MAREGGGDNVFGGVTSTNLSLPGIGKARARELCFGVAVSWRFDLVVVSQQPIRWIRTGSGRTSQFTARNADRARGADNTGHSVSKEVDRGARQANAADSVVGVDIASKSGARLRRAAN